jgi:hypothetical protein
MLAGACPPIDRSTDDSDVDGRRVLALIGPPLSTAKKEPAPHLGAGSPIEPLRTALLDRPNR